MSGKFSIWVFTIQVVKPQNANAFYCDSEKKNAMTFLPTHDILKRARWFSVWTPFVKCKPSIWWTFYGKLTLRRQIHVVTIEKCYRSSSACGNWAASFSFRCFVNSICCCSRYVFSILCCFWRWTSLAMPLYKRSLRSKQWKNYDFSLKSVDYRNKTLSPIISYSLVIFLLQTNVAYYSRWCEQRRT